MATFLLGATIASAQIDTPATIAKQQAKLQSKTDTDIMHKVVNLEAQKFQKDMKKAPKEIMDGFQKSIMALRLLQQNKAEPAKKLLQEATTSFDTALKADPKLGMVPIANNITVNDFTGNAKLIKHIINSAIELLKDNDTQAARDILLPLQDEMTLSTNYIPMSTYPHATKEALKELNKGDTKAAFTTLATALNTIVAKVAVVPIPLLTAQDLVMSASKVAKTDKKEAQKLLAQAQDELQKAVLLGYTKKHAAAYKDLSKQISAIQKEIKGKNIVVKMFDHIKESFDNLISKYESETTTKQAH